MRGNSQQQDAGRVTQQRDNGDEDEGCDEEGADGVGDQPAELLHQNGGDDYTDTAHCVGQHVQKHTCSTRERK